MVISASRHALMPMPDERFHVVHRMHNVHMLGNRGLNPKISPSYVSVLSSISRLDGR